MNDIPKGYEEVTGIPKGYEEVSRNWASVPGEAVSNIPPSAGRLAKGIVAPIIHPVETIEGLSRMMRGGFGISPEEKPAWEATKQFFVDRYGSEEALKKTIAEDPVGFVTDVSTILTAGGGLAAKIPGVVGKVGKTARTVGEVVNPVTLAGKVVGKATAPIREKASDYLTQSAFKIPPSVKMGKKEEMVGTIQKYGLTPRRKGIEKLNSLVDDLKIHAEQLELDASLRGGARIPTDDVVTRAIDPLISKWKNSDLPADYVNVLEKYRLNVINQKKPDMSLSEIIDLKRNLQNQLKPIFAKEMRINSGFKESVIEEAKHTLELEVKRQIEAIIPEYADVNSEIHKLLKVKPFVEQAANRISNYNVLRLTDILFGIGGYSATGDPMHALAAAAVSRIIASPTAWAKVGNVSLPKLAAPVGRAALGARALDLLRQDVSQ